MAIAGFSGDPAVLSPQDTTVFFGAVQLGRLISISVTPYSAKIDDHPAGGVFLGSGGQKRLVKRRYCTRVEPGRCEVRFLGYPVFQAQSVGSTSTLTIYVNGHGLSGSAILESWDVEAVVGDLVRGRCSFTFTGL